MSVTVKTKGNSTVPAVFVLPEEFSVLVSNLQTIKESRKALDRLEKDVKEKILAILPERTARKTFLEVGGVNVAALTSAERKSTNSKMLREEFPDAFDATREVNVVESLTIV